MRIAIASDHAGFRLKGVVSDHLRGQGHHVDDLGTHSEEPVDYPSFCAAAARAAVRGDADFGIVIGGSGQGEQIETITDGRNGMPAWGDQLSDDEIEAVATYEREELGR